MEMLKTNQGGRRRPFRLAAIALSSAAVGALAVGMTPVEAQNPPATDPVPQNVTPVWPGYADLVEKVMPAVVSVTTKRNVSNAMIGGEQRFRGNPEDFERFFEEFEGPGADMFKRFMERFGRGGQPFEGMPFGFGPRGERPMAGAGTGFIFHEDGYIATNNHVVAGADEVTVTLDDGREFKAEVVGTDPDTDLAVLKISADEPLPYVEFGDSDQVRVGDPVVAIGNPFGLGGTVTAGIVSADGRMIGAGRYDNFLQIDAPINRGNSGGPTFNLEGKVIGINTAIHSPTGGNVGIGFAIPSNQAKRIIEDLRDDGHVDRGWLGVHIQTLDEDLAKSLGLDRPQGALIAQVMPDSPAASAGFEQGDVILRYDGRQIKQLRDLTGAVADTTAGTEVDVVVWRDGAEQTIEVEIGQMPGQQQMAALSDDEQPQESDAPKLGVALAQLTPEARERYELPADAKGVVVIEVEPGSPAAEKGLRPGDVIVEADRRQVDDPKAVADAVREAAERGDETVLLLVQRDGQNRFVAVGLERA
ncbi:MAG TPA: DegQ family serine endoprotease [Geminicoccaceae bacterium]|nr:DegQ family serine endoprotease [Geminicoccaceae bacterium]